jgi:hypothetical protein
MANGAGEGRRGDGDLTSEPPAFSDEGMRKIIYRQEGDSRSSTFSQETEELEADLRERRSLVPVVTALAAIFCFGAIIWYAYTWGTGQMASDDLPVVVAQPMPEKVKPEQPGGMDVPHQGIAVLNEGEGGGQSVERLLPAPEAPAPLPQVAEQAETELPRVEEAPLIAEENAEDVPLEDAPEFAEAPEPPAESPLPESTAPETVELADGGSITLPLPKPEEDPAQDQIAELIAEEPLETANGEPDAAPLPEAPQVPAQTAALTEGAVVLQLSSVKSESAAASEWARLQKAHPDQLGGRSLTLDSAVVQGTTYYRVQTGPFASRAAAADLCAQLKARNQDCLVTQR